MSVWEEMSNMVSEPEISTSFEVFEGLFGKQQNAVANNPLDATKHLQYWRKCKGCARHQQELGWITLGPVMSKHTSQEYYDFENSKHAQPLPQYGQYPAGKSFSGPNQKYDVVTPERRFEPLIELNGINEVPLEQMIAYGWHRIPVIVKYIPSLATVVDYRCEFGCANRLFTSQEALHQHVSVRHPNVEQPQAIGQEISKAIEASKFNPNDLASLIVAIREALKTETN